MAHDSGIIPVTDFEDLVFDVYARSNEVKLFRHDEPAQGLFIAESVRVILRALDAGYAPVSLLLEESAVMGEGAVLLKRIHDVPVYCAPQSVLEKITGYPVTRGALCAMRRRTLPSVTDVVENARRIAVLDHIMNPTNVGAIFRNAAALGVDAVILCNGCADPLYRRAVRVSMGNVFLLPWTVSDASYSDAAKDAADAALTIDLKAMGFSLYALALSDDAIALNNIAITKEQKTALFLGSENDGLSKTILESCDHTVMIPMARSVDSLNVAAASAVAFYAFSQ